MKRVAIIGAGASGLPAIKCCLEAGLEPVCFERSNDIGGLWNFKESTENGESSVMRSTNINTSKEMMAYSDFPIPKEFPNFMHNAKVLEYFRMYADHFDLLKYIQFETPVIKGRRAPDFERTGRWVLELRDGKTGQTRTETFDALMLCTGHHADRHVAHFEGEQVFQGQRLHSNEYKDFHGYEGKRVVVVGIGNSGGDIVVELAKHAAQTFLSTRRGSWVLNRISENGVPADYLLNRRVVDDLRRLFPRSMFNGYVEKMLNHRFDHAMYGLKPTHHYDAQHPTVNDELPNRIASGSVIVKPNIRRITKTGVEFDNGTYEDNIDVIIYATGYTFGFPYMEESSLEVNNNQVRLYKQVFPPDVKPATLAVIGCFQPLGALMPISELQCRWALRIFKKEKPLPSVAEMWTNIKKKKAKLAERYVASQRHTIQVDYVTYIEELAELHGCKVNYVELLKTDPRLALQIYFGPATPFAYRLTGPGAWAGARDAIIKTEERMRYPFQTRPVPSLQSSSLFQPTFLKMMIIFVIAVLLYMYIG